MIIDIFNGDGYNHLILLPDNQEVRVKLSADHFSPTMTVRDVKRVIMSRREPVKMYGILPPEIGSDDDPSHESYLMKNIQMTFQR